jgi:hypothetical protein
VIPVSQKDVSGIPPIALEIPDFEGQAILRLFSNNTQSQIGCYTAVVTNGNTFSHPEWVGPILGSFTAIALLSSFTTAVYGDCVTELRKHYAHSLSVGIVFAVWQHIYFSGALSMNWPSVLVAFWSNYAWAGAMIYSERMQNTINHFIGANKGNISSVGAAPLDVENSELGGGYDVHQIYSRESDELFRYGSPARPGIPLPGNYSGFAGTLAQQNIPASNAFMTGFLWFTVLIGIVAVSVPAFKILLELMRKMKMIKSDTLAYFRAHFLHYAALATLRTMYIGFFLLTFLTLFQFVYWASPWPVAVACAVFLATVICLGGFAGYTCFYRTKLSSCVAEPDRLNITRKKLFNIVPYYGLECNSEFPRSEDKHYAGSIPWWSTHVASSEKTIHRNEQFTTKFGWLASRFRRTRWWFFAIWLLYEFVRACFLAGASGYPMVQVYGLLAVETVAFVGLVVLRPFEGQRLNVIVVYLLGFSKVATVALSAAFDHRLNLARIPATIVGIMIIVIQGVLTIMVMFAILIGASTSYMSVMRNRETIRPTRLDSIRERYFGHMEFKELDIPDPTTLPAKPKPKHASEPVIPKEPYFSVSSIRRMPKVEDEDVAFLNEIHGDYSTSDLSLSQQYRDSANSTKAPSLHSQLSFSNLPYGARVHRASWSTHDFSEAAIGRRWTSSLSVTNTPGVGSRPSSGTVPLLNTRFESSNDDINRVSSPLSTSPPITPTKPWLPVAVAPSPMPHAKSRTSGKSPVKKPKFQTVLGKNKIPFLPITSSSFASQ